MDFETLLQPTRVLPAASKRFQTDDVIAERYRVLHLLGRGGMGEVYLVRDLRMERDVVLKLLAGGHDRLTRERFAREMKTMARFSHPNIVAIYDHGEHGDTPWLTMEHVNGMTLRQYMAQQGPLSEGVALTIADQVLNALAEAGEHGLVHRDLKPANIMLTAKSGGLELVKVLDFGIAKALAPPGAEPDEVELPQTLTTPGALVGTPHYMAPEQVLGEAVDGRTDLYGLGCIIYEMLTGTLPVDADSPRGMLLGHLQHKHVPLRDRKQSIAPSTAQLVHRALESAREDRFPDALTMKRQVQALLGGVSHLLGLPPPSSSSAVAVSDTMDSDDALLPEIPTRVSAQLEENALLGEPTLPGNTDPETDETQTVDTGERSLPVPPVPPEPPARTNNRLLWIVGGIALLAVIGLVAVVAWFMGQQTSQSGGPPTASPSPDITMTSEGGETGEDGALTASDESGTPKGSVETSKGSAMTTSRMLDLLDGLSDGAFIGSASGSGSEWEISENEALSSEPEASNKTPDPDRKPKTRCPKQQLPDESGGCIPVTDTEWLSASACLKHGKNCYHLGFKHIDGNPDLAIGYYHHACEHGDGEVCFYLGGLLLGRSRKGDRKRAMRAWQRGCNLGHNSSCHSMIQAWNGGSHGFPKDQKRATRLAVETCEEHGLSCHTVGLNYLEGNGVTQDLQLARKYLAMACNEHDHSRSCERLNTLDSRIDTSGE